MARPVPGDPQDVAGARNCSQTQRNTLTTSVPPKLALGAEAARPGGRGTTHLGPGPSPPPPRAELTVAGPAALGPGVVAMLGVHGAGGVVVQGLYAAHGASLRARPPTALAARLPFTCDPPVGAEQQVSLPGEPAGLAVAQGCRQRQPILVP